MDSAWRKRITKSKSKTEAIVYEFKVGYQNINGAVHAMKLGDDLVCELWSK